MDASPRPPLIVEMRDLPAVHVACITYALAGGQANFAAISERFGRARAWLQGRGLQPSAYLTIGAGTFQGTQQVYDCCIQVPDGITSGSGEVVIKDLPGGRYAVLSMRKEPAVIGETLRRFYHEYVPQNRIRIDAVRPTYEIYFEGTMDYCVPVLEV